MTVLAENQLLVGGRRMGSPTAFDRPRAGARRPSDEALRRPAHGTRVTVRPRPNVTACSVPRTQQRWRLLWLTAAVVCVAIVAIGAVIGGLANEMAADLPSRTAVVAVAPGESLWDVAARYAPESDPRAVVARIEELNGVSADDVTAGLALTVPVGAQG